MFQDPVKTQDNGLSSSSSQLRIIKVFQWWLKQSMGVDHQSRMKDSQVDLKKRCCFDSRVHHLHLIFLHRLWWRSLATHQKIVMQGVLKLQVEYEIVKQYTIQWWHTILDELLWMVNRVLNGLLQLQLDLVQTTNIVLSDCGHFDNGLAEDQMHG